MTSTKEHKNAQSALSVGQLNAIDVLLSGAPDDDAAEAAGVTRETVTHWRTENPVFRAELNRQRQALWGVGVDGLRALVPKALRVLEDALADGDVAAAVQILRAVGMYGSVGAPEGETDPKLLMRQQAEEWAETELQRRGVGKHPDAVVELADKTGYWTQKRELTKQRVAELEDEFRTDHADRGGPNIS